MLSHRMRRKKLLSTSYVYEIYVYLGNCWNRREMRTLAKKKKKKWEKCMKQNWKISTKNYIKRTTSVSVWKTRNVNLTGTAKKKKKHNTEEDSIYYKKKLHFFSICLLMLRAKKCSGSVAQNLCCKSFICFPSLLAFFSCSLTQFLFVCIACSCWHI